jgi:hypothetical protein
MRDVYPVKYYKDEGFVECKIEVNPTSATHLRFLEILGSVIL